MVTLLKVGSYSSTFLYRACPSTIVGLHDITLRKTTENVTPFVLTVFYSFINFFLLLLFLSPWEKMHYTSLPYPIQTYEIQNLDIATRRDDILIVQFNMLFKISY